jgi:hypothetical protein
MEGLSKRLLARQRKETSGQLGTLHARNPRPIGIKSYYNPIYLKYSLSINFRQGNLLEIKLDARERSGSRPEHSEK